MGRWSRRVCEHPMADWSPLRYALGMKPQHYFQDQNEKPGGMARPITTGEINSKKEHNSPPPPRDYSPSPHEVATRAYLNFIRHGSHHGHDVEHWLKAESELRAQHSGSRKHS